MTNAIVREAELGQLLHYDARNSSDLVSLLRTYLEVGRNKTLLGRSSTLSRPTLYARLALIERLLGVDLDDSESAMGLYLALMVLDMAQWQPSHTETDKWL